MKQQHDEERTYCLKLPASLPLGLDDRHWYRITVTCHTSVGKHELVYRTPILGVIHRWLEVAMQPTSEKAKQMEQLLLRNRPSHLVRTRRLSIRA